MIRGSTDYRIEHRAVTNVAKARMSIATFVIPEEEAEVRPLETMMDDTEQKRILYRKIQVYRLHKIHSVEKDGRKE